MHIYATDYTTAPEFYPRLSTKDPELRALGRRLIRVALYDDDREMAREMVVGEIYTFSNIHAVDTPGGGVFFKSGQGSRKIDIS